MERMWRKVSFGGGSGTATGSGSGSGMGSAINRTQKNLSSSANSSNVPENLYVAASVANSNSSTGGFGEGGVGPPLVLTVAGANSATGRRLATSGHIPPPPLPLPLPPILSTLPITSAATSAVNIPVVATIANAAANVVAVTEAITSFQFRKSLSQHVLQPRSASSERRRRRRRKSRTRRTGVSCVGGGGDNMS